MTLAEQHAAMVAKAALYREEHQRIAAEESAKQAEITRPLIERVAALIESIPPEQLAAGIRLEDLASQLAGKYRGHAQPKAVGEALRQLGFYRTRQWRDADNGFRATWHRNV